MLEVYLQVFVSEVGELLRLAAIALYSYSLFSLHQVTGCEYLGILPASE